MRSQDKEIPVIYMLFSQTAFNVSTWSVLYDKKGSRKGMARAQIDVSVPWVARELVLVFLASRFVLYHVSG